MAFHLPKLKVPSSMWNAEWRKKNKITKDQVYSSLKDSSSITLI